MTHTVTQAEYLLTKAIPITNINNHQNEIKHKLLNIWAQILSNGLYPLSAVREERIVRTASCLTRNQLTTILSLTFDVFLLLGLIPVIFRNSNSSNCFESSTNYPVRHDYTILHTMTLITLTTFRYS